MRIRFKHLSEYEIIVAEQFLKRVVVDWIKVECDVPLKVLQAKTLKLVEPWKSMWEYLTAKKIDMVIHKPDKIMLVEVKQKISASAYGQLKLYEKLYRDQYKPTKPLELWHIAMYDDPTVRYWLESMGIKTWVIYRIEVM